MIAIYEEDQANYIKTYELDPDIKKLVDKLYKANNELGELCDSYAIKNNDQTTALIVGKCKDIFTKLSNSISEIDNLAGIDREV